MKWNRKFESLVIEKRISIRWMVKQVRNYSIQCWKLKVENEDINRRKRCWSLCGKKKKGIFGEERNNWKNNIGYEEKNERVCFSEIIWVKDWRQWEELKESRWIKEGKL